MMSLLILNPKILYLVLLITLLYGLTLANQNITVYVEEDGIDQSECMEGNQSIPCHTLSYVLNQINNKSNDTFNGINVSVYVYIVYYQEITNLSHIQLLVNLYLIGVDNPVLDSNGYFFTLCGGCSFYAENITFYKIGVSFYSLGTVSFNMCIFMGGNSSLADIEGLYIKDIYNLTISNCLFSNNDARLALIVIDNVFNVAISGCEFYQNKCQLFLIFIGFEQVHNFTTTCISNCLFHNNDARSALIVIDNVFNVAISGCEFYQNKCQLFFIFISFEQVHDFTTISNCLFHNNDAQFDLIGIIHVSNVEISGCEFHQNKGQDYLISIYKGQIHNLTISNCLFRNNDAQSALIVIFYVFNLEISGCEFYQNKGQEYLIEGFVGYFFDVDNCSIYDNDVKDAIFHLESSNFESMFTITDCLFSNNTSGGNILEITSNGLYMSNINLINNKIKWMEYSIIRITGILLTHEQSLHICNINIINNTGTGLRLKEVSVDFNNITFYNNTGVYGGGMSLYDTFIYLAGPLIFERNTALFGGAIYIARAEIANNPYNCTTFEQIAFSSNFAGTLGADVFIEDGFSVSDIIYFTFPCIGYTISNHVRGDHIISGPYNITINLQNNSTITLFPGQKLTYSAKVTDYFGNLTSCLVNINLECGNNFCEHVQLTGETQSLLSTSNFTTNRYLASKLNIMIIQ